MAVLNAAKKLKKRLTEFAISHYQLSSNNEIHFENNKVTIDNQTINFKELIKQAYLSRISLSATGFYKTPTIHYNRKKSQGQPFFYFATGLFKIK